MKRLSRSPKQIETLNFHAAIDIPESGEQRLASDPDRVQRTIEEFAAGLRDSLSAPSRLRGWFSDQLFGLIAADLGACRLVKQEDAGILFYEESAKLPDWRLTLESGESLLVEVKAENDQEPSSSTLRLSEVARLKRYAANDGTPLYVAIHWVALSLWSLVPIDDFTRVGDHFEVPLITALKRDHMGSLLNDRLLGLVPPMELRMALREDPDDPPNPTVADAAVGDRTQLNVTVTGTRLFAGGQEMLDEREKALVWFLLQHGNWPGEEGVRELGNGEWEMLITAAPEEPPREQQFAIAGRLSELYTRMFVSLTTPVEGEGTTRLSVDVEPGTLPALVPSDLNSERLPLWDITLHPAKRVGTEP